MLDKLAQTTLTNQKLKSTQFEQVHFAFFGIYFAVFALLAIAWLQSSVPLDFLFRDTFAVASAPVYYGLFSNLGIFLWLSSAAIMFFSTSILSVIDKQNKYYQFLLSFGSITLFLAMDDFFMLHERVFPRLLGVSEKVTFLAYGIIVIYSIFRFRRIIFNNNFKIFFIAVLFLFSSIAVDQILNSDQFLFKANDSYFFEDSLKLIGIVTWCFYFIKISAEKITFLNKLKS